MPVTPPTPEQLAALAARDGLGLDEAGLAAFAPLVEGSFGAYDRVEELWAAQAPATPQREWSWPAEGENRWGAWYARCHIEGAPDGPLAGRTLAVKDNTAVAGVPMANGSRLIDGFVPVPGRHGRDAPARRRRDGDGQVGLRGPLLLRRQPHVAHRPGAQPLGPEPHHRRLLERERGAARRRRGRPRHRGRPGRLGAHARRHERDRRPQAHPRAGALHRRLPHRGDDRPPRADDAHRRGRGARPRDHGGTGRARPAPARHDRAGRLPARDPAGRRGPAGRGRQRGLRARGSVGARRRRQRAGRGGDPDAGRPHRRGGVGAVAPARVRPLDRRRHGRRRRPDDRGQRLGHELGGPLRPGPHRALRPGARRGRAPVLRHREDGDHGRPARPGHRARPALRDGAQPPARRPRGLRRGARPVRRAGHAHGADPRHARSSPTTPRWPRASPGPWR